MAPHLQAQLVRAVILTNQGNLATAEEVCRGILRVDPRSERAQYLIAICRLRGGDVQGAISCHHRALRINPTFAMSYVQLGMLSRRRGDRTVARPSLCAAIVLLEYEDEPTLELLSGGLTRSALIEMCRSELDACG